ncbi:MAG: radical SAM protein [Kiritimatiellae bacterium]|nr:radical SAM protein [Kiritimatiellia bacterium]
MDEICRLCPRRCGARRAGGARGRCGAGACARLYRWGLHFGEEPPVSGKRGSGCLFFSHCTMDCIYCQNTKWSRRGAGEDMSVETLAGAMRVLAVDDGAENWNLVSPTPYMPFIRDAARILAKEGVKLPFVWNSSGYETIETLEEYKDFCDVALFDLRYSKDETATAASSAPGYVAAARAAAKWAWERENCTPIYRLLVLPGHADEAVENLRWIARELSSEATVSIMSQYTPCADAAAHPPFDRRVTEAEYAAVTEAAADLGFENGWIQGFEASRAGDSLFGDDMPPGHGKVGKN